MKVIIDILAVLVLVGLFLAGYAVGWHDGRQDALDERRPLDT